jgi:hypothetical protein
MCSDLRCISILHSMLQNKHRWFLSVHTPDDFEPIGEKAKAIADRSLPKLSTFSLWKRYYRWRKSDPYPKLKNSDEYFNAFIAQVCFDLALDKLKGIDKLLWAEICYFDFNFK